MKAYEVKYNARMTEGLKEVVLVNNVNEIRESLAKKDPRFRVRGFQSSDKIVDVVEKPLSSIKLSDLSITEFLQLTSGEWKGITG